MPQIRGLGMDTIDVKDSSRNSDINRISQNSATLRSGISVLNATVGKSQLIRFDEPIKRLSVTKPDLADLVLLSPKELLLNGKASGSTSLIIWGETGDPVFFDLIVKADSTSFQNAAKAIAPNDNLKFKFTDTDKLVLTGKVSSALVKNKIKSLAEAYGYKFTDVSESPTPQVVLEVKVIEASRTFTKNLSNYFGAVNNGQGSQIIFQPQNFTPPSPLTALNFTNQGVLSNNGTINAFTQLGSLTAALTFAESKGLAKTLAEPKLIAVSGGKATFNAGTQIPYPSSIGQGGNVSYDYKNVGVNVTFTPTILEDSDRISLNIAPEVSSLGDAITGGDITMYKIETRKAETTVELRNGQTLLIAGLLQKAENSTTSSPFFSNIPIIGKLFLDGSQTTKTENELMILVTPTIIQPGKNNKDGV